MNIKYSSDAGIWWQGISEGAGAEMIGSYLIEHFKIGFTSPVSYVIP